jgi:DNA repair protein RecO (recombination protein O)
MMLNAIVLRSIKYRDHDLILYLYTRQQGRVSCLLRNARKASAHPQAAYAQPLFLLEIETALQRKTSDMLAVKEIRIMQPLAGIAGNIYKSAIAMFIAETLYRYVREEEANIGLYDFVERHIIMLNEMSDGVSNFHLYFLVQFGGHLGFLPGNTYDARLRCFFDLQTGCFVEHTPLHQCYLDAPSSLLLWQMLHCLPSALSAFLLTHNKRTTLLRGLLQYYSFHLGTTCSLRSLEVLGEVFE